MGQQRNSLVEGSQGGLIEEYLPAGTIQDEESLIEDGRGTLTPVEEVEQKLLRALQASPVLVSRLQRFNRPRPT